MKIRLSRAKRLSGRVLVEVMVGLVLSSMLVAMTGSLWLVGSRTFGAVGTYTELDARSPNALELRSRQLRPATQVTSYQDSKSTKRLRLTRAVAGTQIACTWKATP
jgi:Tfp pilus assembly protein PilW